MLSGGDGLPEDPPGFSKVLSYLNTGERNDVVRTIKVGRQRGTRRGFGTPLCLLVLVALGLPSALAGQGRVGGQGVYQSELLDGTFGAGVRGQLDLGFIFPGLSVLSTYDRYFPSGCGDDCAFWEASGSVVMSGGPSVYFGGGAAFQTFDRPDDQATTEDWLVNFLLGLNLPGTSFLTPFVEARFEAFSETTNQIVFSAGVLFGPRPGPRRGFGGR